MLQNYDEWVSILSLLQHHQMKHLDDHVFKIKTQFTLNKISCIRIHFILINYHIPYNLVYLGEGLIGLSIASLNMEGWNTNQMNVHEIRKG